MRGGQDDSYQRPQSVTRANRSLRIIADDLTGACDAAVAFTAVCDPVRVHIDDQPSDPDCLIAVATESRDLLPAEAQTRIRTIVERLPPNLEIFKKIDSVFRGNTAAEVAATLRHAQYDLAILAPAYPALGRTVRQGALYIHDAAGARTLPIAELLAGTGFPLAQLVTDLTADELTTTLHSILNSPIPAVLCDTQNQEDLARVVHAAPSLGKRILWIGSGGLAHALASELPPLNPSPAQNQRPGRTLFFIGSPHPVTRSQVDHLQRSADIAELIPVILGETATDDIRAFAGHDPAQIGCLFMTGGDTAHFVCRALGINALRLQREFAPGVPLAIAEGGPFDGVSVVLKSGGFGEPDLLCRLLEICLETYHPEVAP